MRWSSGLIATERGSTYYSVGLKYALLLMRNSLSGAKKFPGILMGGKEVFSFDLRTPLVSPLSARGLCVPSLADDDGGLGELLLRLSVGGNLSLSLSCSKKWGGEGGEEGRTRKGDGVGVKWSLAMVRRMGNGDT